MNNIGKVFGCYKILSLGEPHIQPNGSKKKTYVVECQVCKTVRTLNAYKVATQNYQKCSDCPKQTQPLKNSLVDKVFGRLTVLERAPNKITPGGQSKVQYKCKCDCGNETMVLATHLSSGHTTSCGCLQKEIASKLFSSENLIGKTYGKLTVIGLAEEQKKGHQVWKCKCECGNYADVTTQALNAGQRKSCGCLVSEAEWSMSNILKGNNINFVPQYKIPECSHIRPLPFDFAVLDDEKQLVMLIELQGQQHYQPYTFCSESKEQQKENFEYRQKLDLIKKTYCENNKIPLLIIKYDNFSKMEQIFFEFYNQIT